MSETHGINLSEMFDAQFPSADLRLAESYNDPVVRQRFAEIMQAPEDERPGLQAQLNAYLAAAYYLFPDESQVIHNSLNRGDI